MSLFASNKKFWKHNTHQPQFKQRRVLLKFVLINDLLYRHFVPKAEIVNRFLENIFGAFRR